MDLDMALALTGGLAVFGVLAAVVLWKNRTAYLGPVKEELQKEKGWLRRGEYNAAMVKGRQNLELLLKLVAEKNGIQLDNTAQAVATAKEEDERRSQNGQKVQKGRGKEKKVMTHQQFYRWLSENGYLDRVARWEMNQVRLIGNKAVHENYADKDDAWNQFNYLEDILKTVTEKSQNPKKHHERSEKPGKKGNTEKASGPIKDSAEAEKKKRRRRKTKKPQGEAVSTLAVEKKTEEKKAKTKPSKAKTEAKKAEELNVAAETGNTVDVPEAEKKKRRRRRKKKPQGEAASAPTVEMKPEAEAANASADVPEAEKKKRRRRRKKKPQREAVSTPVVETKPEEKKAEAPKKAKAKPSKAKPEEKKAAEAKPEAEAANAADNMPEAEKKKRRRRRRRKPQSGPEGNSAAGTIVPEDKNESI